jgi:hypothetical protein
VFVAHCKRGNRVRRRQYEEGITEDGG